MTRRTVVSAGAVRLLAGALGAGLLAVATAAIAADTVSISPNTDPGGLQVGDTLTFIVSVDSVAPPAGVAWDELSLFLFRIFGPDSFNNAGCEDLSGLVGDIDFECDPARNSAAWRWRADSGNTQTVAGDLVSFTALFDRPGTYTVYLEAAIAIFADGTFRQLNVLQDVNSPIVITVSATPEGLLQQLFEDVTEQTPGKSLQNKVQRAQTFYEADDIPATCAVLNDFIKEVQAQSGKKKITQDVGDQLITDATAIQTAIECP